MKKNELTVKNLNSYNKSRKTFFTATVILFLFTLAMFYDLLFTGKAVLLSSRSTDLYSIFIPFIKFGFGEIKKGNLPLWCPHIFSGMPFMGEFQSALLYPLNLLYLILPFPVSINYIIALHVFLGGVFMYLWSRRRKLHFMASLLSSIIYMFAAPYFLHIYGGHMPVICASAWNPLIFFSIDSFFEEKSRKWVFIGIFAVAMQILSGYPQVVFFTFIAAIIYSSLKIFKSESRLLLCLGIFSIYGGGACLSAVQLITGLDSSGETARAAKVSYEFATTLSLPPENLITLLAPGFFGDMVNFPYWGRWYLWENCLFISITGFILSLYGALFNRRKDKNFLLYVILLLFIFALGKYTPVYGFLYSFVPFFNKFRSPAKFIIPGSLFIIMLSATGFDNIIRDVRVNKWFNLFIFLSGILTVISAFLIKYLSGVKNPDLFIHIIRLMMATGECYRTIGINYYIDFIQKAGDFAFKSLIISSVTLIILSVLFYSIRFSKKFVYSILILAVIEIFFFARISRETFDLSSTDLPHIIEISRTITEDYRIIAPKNTDLTMFTGINQVWGYDPCPIKRYAEFIAFSNGDDPDNIVNYFPPPKIKGGLLYGMLRCRYILIYRDKGLMLKKLMGVNPLKRLELIQNYEVIKKRDEIFSAMKEPDFNPAEKVILEEKPDPEPLEGKDKGKAEIIQEGTDYLIIEASVPDASILLITDTYSKDWNARPLEGSSQEKYKVMPANYILRAIPLSGGYHRILLEYSPLSFRIGKWISIISIIVYILLLYRLLTFTSKLPE